MPILTDDQVKKYRDLFDGGFSTNKDIDALITHYEATIEDLKAQVPQKVELPSDVWKELDRYRNIFPEETWKLVFMNDFVNQHFDTRNARTINFNLILIALTQFNVKEEPTVEDQLRTSWTPKVEKLLADYIGDAAPKVTHEIINGIMPLTREVLKAVEAEEGK